MKLNKIHHVAVICSDYELSKLNKTCAQSEKTRHSISKS